MGPINKYSAPFSGEYGVDASTVNVISSSKLDRTVARQLKEAVDVFG